MVKKLGPRAVPNRDEFYMGMAMMVAGKSKDPSTQCGCVIVDANNYPLGWGYNGPPRKINDKDVDWNRPAKYDLVVHAEVNAIDHSYGDLVGSTLYVTARPCKDCMLRIVHKEVEKVVFYDWISSDKESSLSNKELCAKTEEIADLGGVVLQQFEGNLNWMRERCDFLKEMGIFY